MADRYWVGGTANWDATAGTKWALTSGGTGGQAVPTAADDVFFSNLSTGTCTVTGTCVAKSINCTGFTGTITGTGGLTVSGSITLVAGMGYTNSGSIIINGTGTITSAGKTFSGFTINGAGITVTLGDNFNCGGQPLTITQGTFDTANYNVTCGNFISNNSNVRTINLGSSTITVTASLSFDVVTNLTFNVGTSQINLSNAGPTFHGGGLTFNNVSFTNTDRLGSTTNILGNNIFNNLTFVEQNTASLSFISLGGNQTINGVFSVQSGLTRPERRLFFHSNVIGTARTITSASNDILGVDFQDIVGAGAASWNDSSRTGYWGDCKGNSGITFAAGRNVYWNLSGAQNWSAPWSLNSGGSIVQENFPLVQDTAIFDNAGAVGTITMNARYNIGTVDMSNRTSAMTLSIINNPEIYGNWTNGSGTTISGSGSLIFSGRNTQTITSAGKTFTTGISINSFDGTVQLADNITSASLSLLRGTFDAVSYNVTATDFGSSNSNTRTLNMGSGLWTLSGTGTVWNLTTTTNLTFNKDTADILLSNTTTTARTFAGGGLTYNKLTIGGTTGNSTLTINGTNTFRELASIKTAAHTITFSANQTIATWSVTGRSGNVVTVNSDISGTARTLTITNRTSGIDWLDVRDITAPLTPIVFYAGANTRLRSNVTGVAETSALAPNEYIYVLASGTSWPVPADWNNFNNEIHLFGGGGGGGGARLSVTRSSAGGGGGGGYTRLSNVSLTPSSSITYAIGSGGTGGTSASTTGGAGISGGTTSWNSGAATAGGGNGAPGASTTVASGGAAGTGTTSNGGTGGSGVIGQNNLSGGGGAGAGGPLGVGANGGNSFSSTTGGTAAGGGGGGNGGGTAGGNGTSATGGAGGNNAAGVGGGSSNSGTPGFNGGGGGGANTTAAPGAVGTDIVKAGLGGGGGGGGGGGATSIANTSGNGGLYGGGGAGSGTNAGTARTAGSGAQGAIIIWYKSLTDVVARLTNNGDFVIRNDFELDETLTIPFRINKSNNRIYSTEFNEVTGLGVSMRNRSSNTSISGIFDEISGT